jgi:Flp pilus assembly protein TadB
MSWALVLGALGGAITLLTLGPTTGRIAPGRGSIPMPRPQRAPRAIVVRSRTPDRLADDLATQRTLEALARSLRSGRTLTEALMVLTPDAETTSGGRLLHDTLRVAATAGTSPATVVEHAATVAADRVAARQERRAHAAQARLSATVLTWVPVGVAALATAVDDDIRRVLLTTPLGWVCVGGGVGLGALGRRWITRLTEGSPR